MNRLFVASALVASCAPGVPPATSPPAPLPPPAPAESSTSSLAVAAPGEESSDPHVVRCGVDDRPRAVSLEVPGGRGDLRAKRAPMQPFEPRPPQPGPAVAPGAAVPRTIISIGEPTSPPWLSSAAKDVLADCDAFATADDEGSFDVRIAFASGGSPLRSWSTPDASTTPLARCLLERACRIRGPGDAPAAETTLPVSVKWKFPKPGKRTPRAAGHPPFVVFEGIEAEKTKAFPLPQLRAIVRQVARGCSSGMALGGAEARVVVRYDDKGRLVDVRSEALLPLDEGVVHCLAGETKATAVPTIPAGPLEARLVVDFE